MLVLVELPLLQRALEEAFGADVHQVRLRDLSGFEDAVLNSLMEQLYDELMRRKAAEKQASTPKAAPTTSQEKQAATSAGNQPDG